MNETAFVNKVKVHLKSQCAWVFKTHGHEKQQAGIPDLIGSYEGMFFGIEAKVGDNKATELQRLTLMDIIKSKGIGIIVCLKDKQVIVTKPISPYKEEVIGICPGFKGFCEWLTCFFDWRK